MFFISLTSVAIHVASVGVGCSCIKYEISSDLIFIVIAIVKHIDFTRCRSRRARSALGRYHTITLKTACIFMFAPHTLNHTMSYKCASNRLPASLFSPSSLLVIAVLFTGPSRWKSVKWSFGSHFGSPSVRESC